MTDNQHDKPKLENVYRTKSRCILRKSKWYTDEMWNDLLLTSEGIINSPKQ